MHTISDPTEPLDTPPHDTGHEAPVPEEEHYQGYGIMALPFDSRHVLALRVMHESDFGPFSAVWHRTPDGRWSMYVDASRPERFCPRLFGPVLEHWAGADIRVSWSGEAALRVRMEAPRLDWTVRLRSSVLTRIANRVLPRISLEAYRKRPTLALIRTLAHRALGTGPMDLAGTVPGGQDLLVRARRLHLVAASRAELEGVDLGSPVRARSNPRTGSFRWPARGILAEGDIYVAVDDPAAYLRLRG